MPANPFTEDHLVEQPAIALFAALGWQTAFGEGETFGPAGTFGRETKSEAILPARLRRALVALNPGAPAQAIAAAIDQITQDRSAMSLAAANREVYRLLKDGAQVSIPDPSTNGQTQLRVRLVDWDTPANNDFLLVSQFTVLGGLYTCRPDLVGFVNGLPLVVVELKKPAVPARAGFDDNLTHYKREIPQLFWPNAFLIASNGLESRIGSLTADWDRFFEWKRIEREDEPPRVSLEVLLRGVCAPARLMDLLENFILFSEHTTGLVKILAQNHQFLGVNNAIASVQAARAAGHGRGGVFWQTQGSGKSFSMVFFAQKILRKLAGNWTFVIVTDRVELDKQIAETFKNTGAVLANEGDTCHATSGAHLRELLSSNQRYVFTLIHKFQSPELLTDRSDVIVLTDEAHRSQYDSLALNMRGALPNALFLAFTGTPLIAGEERTKDVFGDYVSIYDFQQSVQDGATVPLFYQNRTPELELVNPLFNEDMTRLIDEAGLDDEQETKLEKTLGQQYHLITRDDRLDTIARDIVQHFLGRGFLGKGMVVSIDKATALRMHDKVRAFWQEEAARVQAELNQYRLPPLRKEELLRRQRILASTDMAVIVSSAQNEIEAMRKLGLDIEPHRKRMNDTLHPLDKRFKDPADPLRLVFVCAMWLTGFDAPSCSTIYLDKPMRNHTLMQTIARANRVYLGKHSGLIVDYASVFASLEQALALYGMGGSASRPVKDKRELVEDLRNAIAEAERFCASLGVNLLAMGDLSAAGFAQLEAVKDAVNTLISPDPRRQDFLERQRLVGALYGAVLPDPAAQEFTQRALVLQALADAIRSQLNPNPPDISEVLRSINILLDESITGLTIRDAGPPPIDLSRIDFEALSERFKQSKYKNTDLETLKAAIRARLERMVQLNRTRANFAAAFEALIESYNAGARGIDDLLEELLALSRNLDEEEQRHVREHMSEEELAIFDILTRPAPELTPEERAELKKVAKDLLERIQTLLTLNWRQKAASRSKLKETIEETLDAHLPIAYTPELYRQKCAAVFEHVYESYAERNASVYA